MLFIVVSIFFSIIPTYPIYSLRRQSYFYIAQGFQTCTPRVVPPGLGILLRDPGGLYEGYIKVLGKPFRGTTLGAQPWNPGIATLPSSRLWNRCLPSQRVQNSAESACKEGGGSGKTTIVYWGYIGKMEKWKLSFRVL